MRLQQDREQWLDLWDLICSETAPCTAKSSSSQVVIQPNSHPTGNHLSCRLPYRASSFRTHQGATAFHRSSLFSRRLEFGVTVAHLLGGLSLANIRRNGRVTSISRLPDVPEPARCTCRRCEMTLEGLYHATDLDATLPPAHHCQPRIYSVPPFHVPFPFPLLWLAASSCTRKLPTLDWRHHPNTTTTTTLVDRLHFTSASHPSIRSLFKRPAPPPLVQIPSPSTSPPPPPPL